MTSNSTKHVVKKRTYHRYYHCFSSDMNDNGSDVHDCCSTEHFGKLDLNLNQIGFVADQSKTLIAIAVVFLLTLYVFTYAGLFSEPFFRGEAIVGITVAYCSIPNWYKDHGSVQTLTSVSSVNTVHTKTINNFEYLCLPHVQGTSCQENEGKKFDHKTVEKQRRTGTDVSMGIIRRHSYPERPICRQSRLIKSSVDCFSKLERYRDRIKKVELSSAKLLQEKRFLKSRIEQLMPTCKTTTLHKRSEQRSIQHFNKMCDDTHKPQCDLVSTLSRETQERQIDIKGEKNSRCLFSSEPSIIFMSQVQMLESLMNSSAFIRPNNMENIHYEGLTLGASTVSKGNQLENCSSAHHFQNNTVPMESEATQIYRYFDEFL